MQKPAESNGNVGAVVNFKTTDPDGWDKVKKPKCRNACDAVVYECHVRDFSADSSSGVAPGVIEESMWLFAV